MSDNNNEPRDAGPGGKDRARADQSGAVPPPDAVFSDEAVEYWEEDDLDLPANARKALKDPFEEDEDTQPDAERVPGAVPKPPEPDVAPPDVRAAAAGTGTGQPDGDPFRSISSFLALHLEREERKADELGRHSPVMDVSAPGIAAQEVSVGSAGLQAREPEGHEPGTTGDDTVPRPLEEPGSDSQSSAIDTAPFSVPEGAEVPDVPNEPFFPIPDIVPPSIPHEDTAEYGTPGRRKRRIRKRRRPLRVLAGLFLWTLLLVFLGLLGAGLMYYRYASARLMGTDSGLERWIVITVNPGERFSQILQSLRKEKLLGSYMGIDDKYLMKAIAWYEGNSKQIKSGVYRLNSSVGLRELYDKLIQGSKDFRVTIPEGKTTRQIAALIKDQIESFNKERFVELTKDSGFIGTLGLDLPSLEGYLFPSAYFFGPGMKEEDLVKTMVKTFIDKTKQRLQNVVKKDDLTFHQHIVMASLIEREARIDADRPLIASVIYNRLKQDRPLEIDATVCFAINDWSRKLTIADTKVESPYNTYLVKGLPPGPICNPGIESIAATFEPAATDYLFYVYKGDGSHAFAKTYDEHLANRRLFQRSGSEAAGANQQRKSPSPSETPAPPPSQMPPPEVGSDVPTSAVTGGTTGSESSSSTATKPPRSMIVPSGRRIGTARG